MTTFGIPNRARRWLLLMASAWLVMNGTSVAQFRGNGMTVFTDPDYRGESASFRDDTPDLVRYGLNDEISSIRVPPGESWEICQDIDFGNRCQVIARSISDLRSVGWNDRISSLRRVRSGGFGRGRRANTRSFGLGNGITVFTDADFDGESASFREDVPDLQSYRLNDEISSIRVQSGDAWEVCQDIYYGNRCQVITRSTSNLRSIGWDNRISSLRRLGGGGFRRGSRGGDPRVGAGGGVTVFADPDFKGESASFRADTPDLVAYGLNDEISSIRISPGEAWEICQDIDYGNQCQVITRSISSLRNIGWNDRISSLRRVER